MKNGSLDVKKASWFGKLNWKALVAQELPPFHTPVVNGEGDTSNFDQYPESPDVDPEEDYEQDQFGTISQGVTSAEIYNAFMDLDLLGFGSFSEKSTVNPTPTPYDQPQQQTQPSVQSHQTQPSHQPVASNQDVQVFQSVPQDQQLPVTYAKQRHQHQHQHQHQSQEVAPKVQTISCYSTSAGEHMTQNQNQTMVQQQLHQVACQQMQSYPAQMQDGLPVQHAQFIQYYNDSQGQVQYVMESGAPAEMTYVAAPTQQMTYGYPQQQMHQPMNATQALPQMQSQQECYYPPQQQQQFIQQEGSMPYSQQNAPQ